MGAPNLVTRYARAMIAAAEAQGHDLEEICRLADISPASVAADCLIDPEIFGKLNRTVKALLDDEFCGFARAPRKAGTFIFVCETILREETLSDALDRAFRFYSLISDDIRFTLDRTEDVATITLTLAEPERDRYRYLHEWWLMIWPHFSSWLIGEEIPVLRVDFPYEPSADLDEYAAAFWGPCHFSQAAARVQFPARFLGRRNVRTLEDVRLLFTRDHMDLVSIPGVHRSWRTRLKAKMKERLFQTETLPSIEDLAAEFNISSQTLRRRLDEEGISFRGLKDEVRREVVLKWLAEPDIPIGEVSLRAGFAERNGLVRAVRAWVGLSPKEYRGLVTAQPPSDLHH